MLLLGVDVETTGLDMATLSVTELGAVLYDTEYGMPVDIQADLIIDSNLQLPLDPKVEKLTGIKTSMLEKYGRPAADVIPRFCDLYKRADFVVAHNGNRFDREVIKNFSFRNVSLERLKLMMGPPKHWIDTLTDLPYDELITTRKLEDLTGRHGFLNPFPHRAFSDVLSMLKILSQYNLEEVIAISKSVTKRFVADVPFHQKDLAKDAGFKWDGAGRVWFFEMKEYFLDKEKYEKKQLWDFPYREIQIETNQQ